ncbi:MAG: hypothetical protein ACPGEG_10315 [Salibacteraceae bacterium]
MDLQGTWVSKDDKYEMNIEAGIEGDFPFSVQMPIAGSVKGVLKKGELAHLKFEVNNTPVFVYLFVARLPSGQIEIKGTGRSTGRFKGDIPNVILTRN